jgi:predicted ATPase/class 3 adenylate cyclase
MAETQVVTVAFTDLVASTETSSRLDPDVADQLRATHFSLLRQAIASHGGTEVKNLGDGLMVVFSITSGALNCAEAMQQAIDRYNKRASVPLLIRIGLSLGEVTEEENDYFGDAVIEASRLCARAEGGQILASQLVQLTVGRRARQEFVSLGDLELKGLPAPVAAVEVRWARSEAVQGEVLLLPARCMTAPAAGFVGRAAESAVLSSAFKGVTGEGRHHLVLIGGEPGIGKTTLATEFSRSAHDDGAIVLFGHADEDLAVPYGPWAEAITHLVTNAPEGLLESLAIHNGSLTRLAPALTTQLRGSDASTTNDPEAARYMLFNAVTTTLRLAGEVAPVVVVLDDLQWADTQTLQLIRHVAATSEAMRVMVIGTFRESDISADHPLTELLSALHREQCTERISLRGLSDLELLALMEAAAGEELTEDGLALRDAVLAETDGNPFFAGELLRHLVESGAIYQEDDHWVASDDLRTQGLPVSVREVIGRRVARLGDQGTRVLALASVIGRDFDLGLVAAASELSEDTLLDLMDRAIEATLVENVRGTRYSFVHALIEHTLYDSLSPARRARIHRAVAEAIESQARGQTEGRTAELAYHWGQATAPEDLDKAAFYAQLAGDEALARLAPDEALRSYTQALSLLEQRAAADTGKLRCALLVGLGNAQRQTGNASYRETLLDAAHVAIEVGETDLLVAAALANNRGLVSAVGVVDTERTKVLEAACNALEGTESAELARLLALLSLELHFSEDVHRRRELADEALTMARRIGDPATLIRVIQHTTFGVGTAETLTQQLSLSAESFELSQDLGDPVLQFFAAAILSLCLIQAGRTPEGKEFLRSARAIAERLGQPSLRWTASFIGVGYALLSGELDETEQLNNEAFAVGNASGEPDAPLVFAAALGRIRSCQGRGAELIDLITQVAEDNPGVPAVLAFLSQLYCDLGRYDEARAVLEPYVADGFASLPDDMTWLLSMSLISYSVAQLRWVEAAEVLIERLRPLVDQIAIAGVANFSSVSFVLALLAATLGRADEAEDYFSRAADTLEKNGVKWGLAMNQLAWGQYLVEWDRPGDQPRASALLGEALRSARDNGYGLVERRAQQTLESLRSR